MFIQTGQTSAKPAPPMVRQCGPFRSVARAVNPAIDTVVRTHSDAEAVSLTETAGVGLAVMGERDARAAADTLFEQFVGGCAREGARNCG